MTDQLAETQSNSTPAVPFEGPPANALVTIGRFFFKWRNAFFPIVFLTVGLAAKPYLFGGSRQSDLVMDIVGLSLAAVGQALRSVTIGLDYIKRGGRKKRVYADNLVTGGVFAHGRNPLYVGNMLQVIGLVVIHNSPWMYAIILPLFVLIYVSIVAAEEQFLHAKFGDEYAEYCRRVSRWGVSPFGWSRTLAAGHFDWLKLIRKEYGTPFSWISVSFLIMAYESIRNVGLYASQTRLEILGWVWLPLVVLYCTARVLKKSDRLGSDQ